MKMNELGRTGIKVSELCLGSMTWGTQNSEAEGCEQIDYALDQGINFIDTAEMYPTTPLSEETQGDTEALDTSLKSMQTDYVDLYQLHWPNRGSYAFRQLWTFDPTAQDTAQTLEHMEEVLDALAQHVKSGKIRSIGLSNESAWGTANWLRIAEEKGLPRVASVQNEYSLLCRYFDLDMSELCHHEDVGLLSFSPLACGLLTGKYIGCEGDHRPSGSRADVSNASLGGRWNNKTHRAIDAYAAIAKKHNVDLTQMALSWCLTRPFMASVIFGATTMDQLKIAIGSAELQLSEDIMADILSVYKDYPIPY